MIHFRKAGYEDIDRIIEVQNRSFYEDFEMYGECPAYNESREAIKKQIDEAKVYVIEYDGEIIGDIIVRVRSEGCYYLRVLSILPEYHNKGIGQMAIQFMENENPEAKLWHLITPYKSFRNHHFYEKMGYVKVSEYKHSDCLTMFEYKKTIAE